MLLFSVVSFANVHDYLNVKPLCEKLAAEKSVKPNALTSEASCGSKHDLVKAEVVYPVVIHRYVEEDKEAEKINTEIPEVQLKAACKELKSMVIKGEEIPVLTTDIKVSNVDDKKKKQKRRWTLSVTFGPFVSYHDKLSLHLKNHDTDVVIENLGPTQRTSFRYYQMFGDGIGPGQFIDEPQNDITFELSNGSWFFGLRYSHPKTLFQDRHDNPQLNPDVNIRGTIGGYEVDEQGVDLKDYIHTLSTSHRNTNLGVFGGKEFKLFGEREKTNLMLRLEGGFGISVANGVSKYWAKNEAGNRYLDITEYEGIKPYGWYGSAGAELRLNLKRFLISGHARFLQTHIDGPMGALHAEGTLTSYQFGAKVGYNWHLPTKKERAQRKIARIEKREGKKNKVKSELERLQEEMEALEKANQQKQ